MTSLLYLYELSCALSSWLQRNSHMADISVVAMQLVSAVLCLCAALWLWCLPEPLVAVVYLCYYAHRFHCCQCYTAGSFLCIWLKLLLSWGFMWMSAPMLCVFDRMQPLQGTFLETTESLHCCFIFLYSVLHLEQDLEAGIRERPPNKTCSVIFFELSS